MEVKLGVYFLFKKNSSKGRVKSKLSVYPTKGPQVFTGILLNFTN